MMSEYTIPSSPASSNSHLPNISSPTSPSKKRKAHSHLSTSTILLLIFSNGVSFLGGAFFASNAAMSTNFQQMPYQHPSITIPNDCPLLPKCPECPSTMTAQEAAAEEENEKDECPPCPPEKQCPATDSSSSATAVTQQQQQQQQLASHLFPEIVNRFAVGMAHTPQQNFTKAFDLGVPIDRPVKEGESGVLIIYSSPKAMPRGKSHILSTTNELLSPQQATENCDHLHVILTDHSGQRRQCLALVPQYESFHIQKWLRVPKQAGKPATGLDPLRMVPRGYSLNGVAAFHPPKHERHTKKAWKMLKNYLDSLDDVLEELTPIVKKIAKDNAIVVMVCNHGQSQLLLNFACAARSKALDISNVLVFATDEETQELAENIGLTSYFDKRNFGSMPKKAAKTYGDYAFTTMMLSKVICVHLASMLGVDFLFQDVDVMWFKNPLDFFQDKNNSLADFDAIFQDDGSRSVRFSPFCANSGFYFIRHNERTQYFLTSFLMQSDLVLRSNSHQAAMISVLAEHSSLLGLKVKVLEPADFPSGFIYHRKKTNGVWGKYFMELFDGKQNPYIFHMSWTENKENKIKFYRQLDQWYLQDQCMDKKLSEIPVASDSTFVDTCCSAEPLFKCYFSDKPSSRPCKDSPTLDKNGKSYW